jgi:hypothetical protein
MSGELFVVQWDRKAINRFGQFGKAAGRAAAMAGRDALRTLRTESSRRIRERKAFKLSAVNRALSLSFPSSSSDLADLEWRMDVSGKPMPLSSLSPRQTSKGVSVSINAGKRVLIRSAFEAKMPSGHEGVFMRAGKGRLPIRELFTSRITDVFRDAGFVPDAFARATGVFRATFDRVLPLEIDKLK